MINRIFEIILRGSVNTESAKAKKILKRLAFPVKSDTNLLFINRAGINGTLVPLQNNFQIYQ